MEDAATKIITAADTTSMKGLVVLLENMHLGKNIKIIRIFAFPILHINGTKTLTHDGKPEFTGLKYTRYSILEAAGIT